MEPDCSRRWSGPSSEIVLVGPTLLAHFRASDLESSRVAECAADWESSALATLFAAMEPGHVVRIGHFYSAVTVADAMVSERFLGRLRGVLGRGQSDARGLPYSPS